MKDVNVGATNGMQQVASIKNTNGTTFFVADDGINGQELWKTDGTNAGTMLVKDINVGSTGSSPFNLFVSNNKVFFRADDGINGMELWVSDGTAAGTIMLKDIFVGAQSGAPTSFTDYNGQVVFSASESTLTKSVWKTPHAQKQNFKPKQIIPCAKQELS